jgi:hypothetical protein
MADGGVRVVALRPTGDVDLQELPHGDELVQRVVDGRPADLGEPLSGEVVHLLGGQVDVLADEHLCDGASLGAQAPVARPQTGEQVDRHGPRVPLDISCIEC